MLAGILAFIGFLGQVLGLINRIYDARKEKNDEEKKRKTELVQNGARAIIDRDASRIVATYDELRRLKAGD